MTLLFITHDFSVYEKKFSLLLWFAMKENDNDDDDSLPEKDGVIQ